jgi:hypothetical protein
MWWKNGECGASSVPNGPNAEGATLLQYDLCINEKQMGYEERQQKDILYLQRK